ncbi:hypothetical protein I8751_14310 [Nostocaceae cyanobacterium CENA357]|uniref:Uncharacterized protein n=1 Tax=Atlanticothrix silvestris CENA357 TaxID=1725252 RepID=A0A8J7L5W9_9CYAN|nr:hypothetical protein [Atlanticothrix silvestris]MBH8553522.1 hypothetical protein [Atlanticothrix silvestris CENA357]
MSKIQYPTLDLFIYNIIEGSGNSKIYQDYWLSLPDKLKDKDFSNKINDADAERLDFWNTISTAVDGCYSQVKFDDTNCLRFSCSLDRQIELTALASTFVQLKDLSILPQVENLTLGRFSKNGYLGQTWIISGWTVPDNSLIDEITVQDIYKSLITQAHQYQQKGEFLGATVWEMWRGEERWEGIEKDSHVMLIFYPEEAKFAAASQYYNAWRYLFYCKHKILWSYEQGRTLKLRLLQQFKDSLTDTNILSKKDLQELKEELQININSLSKYVQNINLLPIQQHTVEVNLKNYDKQCQKYLFNEQFLKEFSNIVKNKYQVQLEKDYLSLNPGLAILENVTTTIRGMVEIEQAKRDRNLNNTVAIAGVGLATSQIASSIILAQEPPPQDLPFFQTTAFWWSLATGLVANLILWSILRLYRLITRSRR